MGGTLAVTVRLEDGKEHRMSQWTNSTPSFIDNMKLVNKEPDHLDKVINEWLEESSKKKPHWAYNSPFLAPSEYGLVVVDLLKNKILDCNGYHHFGKIFAGCLSNEYNATITKTGYTLGFGTGDGIRAFIDDKGNEAARFFNFYKTGRIKDVIYFDAKVNDFVSLNEDVNKWTIEKILDDIILSEDTAKKYSQFILDMSPFEVISFEESAEGFSQFRQAVIDLGFKLTVKEEKIWAKKIKRCDE